MIRAFQSDQFLFRNMPPDAETDKSHLGQYGAAAFRSAHSILSSGNGDSALASTKFTPIPVAAAGRIPPQAIRRFEADRASADDRKRTLHCSNRALSTESSPCRSDRIQSPAIVKPSTSRLGTQYGLNGSGSLAGINDFRKCFRFPAIVSSLTGYSISPFSTQNPDAPRE